MYSMTARSLAANTFSIAVQSLLSMVQILISRSKPQDFICTSPLVSGVQGFLNNTVQFHIMMKREENDEKVSVE